MQLKSLAHPAVDPAEAASSRLELVCYGDGYAWLRPEPGQDRSTARPALLQRPSARQAAAAAEPPEQSNPSG